MNNDRELLELAYKAANGGALLWDDKDVSKHWNPLTNDGDALRLAVKLGLHVVINTHKNHVQDTFVITPSIDLMEMHNKDPYAATRRAITRAAAEIGRTM